MCIGCLQFFKEVGMKIKITKDEMFLILKALKLIEDEYKRYCCLNIDSIDSLQLNRIRKLIKKLKET